MLETFLQYRKKLNILIILSLPLAVSHEAGKPDVSRRAGQFREVITSKFISLRDYQVPIKTVSSKLQVRWGWRWLGQDKWPALRATHINANLGCLDYHAQWNDQSSNNFPHLF